MESYVFCLVFVFNVITHSIAKNDEIYSKMDGRTKGYVNWLSLPQNNPTTKPDQDVPIQESDFARKTTKKCKTHIFGCKEGHICGKIVRTDKETNIFATYQSETCPANSSIYTKVSMLTEVAIWDGDDEGGSEESKLS